MTGAGVIAKAECERTKETMKNREIIFDFVEKNFSCKKSFVNIKCYFRLLTLIKTYSIIILLFKIFYEV